MHAERGSGGDVSSSSSTYRQGLTQQRSLIHNMVFRWETSALHYEEGAKRRRNSDMVINRDK